jgi:tRNA(Ile)-lysidine synthase
MNSRIQNEFARTVAQVLERNRVRPGAAIITALSGGADSVALLHCLLALSISGNGCRIIAAHLNHRLRGAEADRDEAFVRALCERLELELVVEQAQGLDPAAGNLEERSRILRHEFLNRTAERYNADYIALAHHSDDQAETVLLRLMRGCGIAGASGMAEAGPGRLLRPLLGLTRADVIAYLEARGEPWVTDSSNLAMTNGRSRVRNHLIPLLEREYAPSLSRRLSEFATELHATSDFITMSAEAELKRRMARGGSLDLAGFAQLHPALAHALLREYLRMRRGDLRRVNRVHIESMRNICVDGPVNGLCDLPDGWRMRRAYGTAIAERVPRHAEAGFEIYLEPGVQSRVEAGGLAFTLTVIEPDGAFLALNPSYRRIGPMEALFDQDCGDGFALRSFRPGDRIRPLGMEGTRKVHDLFIDYKLPRDRRPSWPLVTARDGEILWIPGMARSRSALITPASRRAFWLTAEAGPAAAYGALPRI